MKVLLIGHGAREHAIAEQIAKSSVLYAYMGHKNPGIARLAAKYFIGDITNPEMIGFWAATEGIDIAIVGSDPSLAAGVTDALLRAGVAVASPTKEAARIEWNKAYARELLNRHKIPGSPEHFVVRSEEELKKAFKEFEEVAVKPTGLTGGKGVKVMGDHFKNKNEAKKYAEEILKKEKEVVIEERLVGEEFSLQAFVDGSRISAMPPVQDFKRAFENDEGPNTGGMGSYSTGQLLPFMERRDLEEAKEIMEKTVKAMAKEGVPFKGVLYGGFMITSDGVKLIEYNARFGDPEAMNVLPLLRTEFVEILWSIVDGRLKPAVFAEKNTVVKYLVPNGYPDKPKKDAEIKIDEKCVWDKGAKLYFGSVYEKDGKVYTTGSRAVALFSKGESLEEARFTAEGAIMCVKGPLFYRKDIGTNENIEKKIRRMKEIRG
ncbi:MAG: phosphoribosylamine--glycine ligase [Candidatus Anstonellales archaeon]